MRKHRGLLVLIVSLLVVAVIVTVVLVGLGSHSEAATSGTITSLTGEVLVQKQSATNWIQAVSGMKLSGSDRLKTGGNGTALITFFEGSTMEVQADSEIVVSELAVTKDTGSTTIRLKQLLGNTVNRVQKLADPASKYEVETAAGSAVVRGTVFNSYVRGDGYTIIGCEEGSVWFTAGGVTVLVSEGTQSSAMPGGTPSQAASFHLENVKICSDVRGDKDYTVRAEASFNPGERVWVYFEAFGLGWNSSGGKYEVWFRATDVKVYSPDSGLYVSGTNPIDFHQTQLEEVPDYLWGALYVDLQPNMSAGQYKADLVLEDVFSGKTDSVTVYFSVSSAQP
jgi:FecR protein